MLVLSRSPPDRLETNPRRNLLDRGSIAPRSRFDLAAIVEFFHELPTLSDWNPTLQRSSRRGADRASRGRQIRIRRSHDLHEKRRIALLVAVGLVKSGRLDGLNRAINPRCDHCPFKEDPRSEKCHVAAGKPSITST